MKKLIFVSVFALVSLVSFMFYRASNLESMQVHPEPIEFVELDDNIVLKNLSKAIQYKTISSEDRSETDPKPFIAFHSFLKRTYPRIFKNLDVETFNGLSILIKWEGSDSDKLPALLMAHMDVVPATGDWDFDPFSGEISDGYIWGRGSIDDKSSMMGILESVEYLLRKGHKPSRTIYLAFGHDEENTGNDGAREIAKTLQERNVYFEFVLDEGMIIAENLIDGINSPVAMVGVAEKGYATFELTSSSDGGHSSMPGESTSIGQLSKAITMLDENPMEATLTSPVKGLFKFIGPEMSSKDKFVFANQDILSSVIVSELEKSTSTNAMVRTTIAPTMIEGGIKENILPRSSSATVNFRIIPGQKIKDVKSHIEETLSEMDIKITLLDRNMFSEPSKVSSMDSESFMMIQKTIMEVFPDVVFAPSIVLGGTDSRYFSRLSRDIYRFMPIKLKVEDVSMIHGLNEKISTQSYLSMVQFYVQLVSNIDAL